MRKNKNKSYARSATLFSGGSLLSAVEQSFSGRIENFAQCSIFHDSPVSANDGKLLNWNIRHIWTVYAHRSNEQITKVLLLPS